MPRIALAAIVGAGANTMCGARSISSVRYAHPAEMGAGEVTAFLTSLAVRDRVAASTQNQALNAILFLYGQILEADLPWLDLAANQITIRGGKGGKDRITMLPTTIKAGLGRHLERVRAQHVRDLAYGAGWVPARIRDAAGDQRGRSESRPREAHVLNRGPAAVRSPLDRMFRS